MGNKTQGPESAGPDGRPAMTVRPHCETCGADVAEVLCPTARADFEQLYDDTTRLLTDELGADPEMLTQEAA